MGITIYFGFLFSICLALRYLLESRTYPPINNLLQTGSKLEINHVMNFDKMKTFAISNSNTNTIEQSLLNCVDPLYSSSILSELPLWYNCLGNVFKKGFGVSRRNGNIYCLHLLLYLFIQ